MRDSPYRAPHINPDKIALARHLRREMTPTEKVLWSRLRANQLDGFHFRRQVVIEGYVADFYCHVARLVVEVAMVACTKVSLDMTTYAIRS